jgi:ketosteroid isomerase-like protein
VSSQTQSNIEIVQGVYDAYGSKDVDALMAPLHDDFQISASDPLPWGGRFKGRDGMMEFIGKISSFIDSRVDVDEMVEAGDHVIAIGRSAGTIKATGKEYAVRLVDVCEIRDGKVLSIDIYLDTPAILAALAE